MSDMPVITNEAGGMQSKVGARFDIGQFKALIRVAEVTGYGAEKYAANNWRLIDVNSHLNHGMIHILEYLAGDKSEAHLEHAAWRILSALELAIEQGTDRNPPGPQIKGGAADKSKSANCVCKVAEVGNSVIGVALRQGMTAEVEPTQIPKEQVIKE
jgi:hypothetical protein